MESMTLFGIEGLGTDIISVALMVILCLVIRTYLISIGQHWIQTFTHTATFFTLPVITFVITKVISGNIALSLGMVGALSIIRFRNPVKSPFELVIYFLAITMGISSGVSFKWTLLLPFFVISIFILLSIIDFIFRNFLNRNFFQASFTEGNELSLLEIRTNEKIPELAEEDSLIALSELDNEANYTFAASRKEDLLSLKANFENDSRVLGSSLKI